MGHKCIIINRDDDTESDICIVRVMIIDPLPSHHFSLFRNLSFPCQSVAGHLEILTLPSQTHHSPYYRPYVFLLPYCQTFLGTFSPHAISPNDRVIRS
jgi:hypothetical protein